MAGSPFGADIPFVNLLGFELVRFNDGQSELSYAARPEHLNSFGVAHGGACLTLLDVTMAAAARSVAKELGVVTIEMKTSFMRAARIEGGALRGEGHLLQRTGSLAFCEARLYDAAGQLCAHATGTFKYVPRGERGAMPAISTD